MIDEAGLMYERKREMCITGEMKNPSYSGAALIARAASSKEPGAGPRRVSRLGPGGQVGPLRIVNLCSCCRWCLSIYYTCSPTNGPYYYTHTYVRLRVCSVGRDFYSPLRFSISFSPPARFTCMLQRSPLGTKGCCCCCKMNEGWTIAQAHNEDVCYAYSRVHSSVPLSLSYRKRWK